MNELSHLTLHSTLADLPTSDFKVDEQTFGEEIETAFHQNPDLPGVMVTARDRIVGILPRGKFFEWIGRRYGIELYLKRPIRVLLDATIQELNDRLELDVYPTRCLLLSHQSSIEQAVEIALSRPTFLAYEPIVVAGVDREWRLLDMYVLLQAQSRQFELAKDAADAANLAKSDFLASMSHELRTPLNSILGFTQIMSRDTALSGSHQQHLGIISRAGEHLLDLIGDVLDMSKIESGRTTLNPTHCDLYRLLDNLHEMLQLKAVTKGLQLIFECEENVPQYGRIDAGKLRQVLINLLGNAIKFTETGCVTLRVRGEDELPANLQTPTSRRLHFEVEDTGAGIAPEEISGLFTPFGQTETGRNSGTGTGLGLAIAQHFVGLMGGEIRVTSTVGKGTTFSFDIAIESVPATDIPASPQRRHAIALAPGLPQYRILVADDRPEARLVLVELLTSLGFSVREAQNGREAVELHLSYKPHLIVMDMQMPVMDGLEATRQIKRQPQEPATAIVALTASSFDDERQALLAAGCDDFLNKPFREAVLLEIVARHLGVRYLYEDQTEKECQSTVNLPARDSDRILQTSLARMPSDWVEKLYQAALKCRDDLIVQLTKAIPDSDAELTNCLVDWANNFLFDRIIELIQAQSSLGVLNRRS